MRRLSVPLAIVTMGFGRQSTVLGVTSQRAPLEPAEPQAPPLPPGGGAPHAAINQVVATMRQVLVIGELRTRRSQGRVAAARQRWSATRVPRVIRAHETELQSMRWTCAFSNERCATQDAPQI